MNWLEDLNAATAYIDEHLDGDLSVAAVACRASCSEFQLQRMFPYLTGMTLGEYVRRRKMTRAAADLRASPEKIIDVARRYGYDSPTAFTRAFKSVHGISPTEARMAGAALVTFPRLVFTLTVKGEQSMNYKIVDLPEFRVVGIASNNGSWDVEDAGEKATEFWGALGPRVHEVLNLMDGSEPAGLLGVQFCRGQEFDGYLAAVATQAPCPEGMEERVVPAATYAVFECTGPMPQAMTELWHRIFTEWLPSSGYRWASRSDVERYLTPNMTQATSQSEVWLPVEHL